MATLHTDLSIPIAPPTTIDAATPDVLPFAIEGATAEPSLGRETTGWQSGVIPPAEQENWMRQKLWAWLGRASCTGFFTQRNTKAIALGGSLVAGNVVRMSYNGTNNDYTVTAQNVIDGFDATAAAWAQQLTETAALRSTLDAQGATSGNMLVFYRSPGVAFPHAVTVSVVSGTTTVAITDLYGGSAGTLLVTTTPGGGNGNTLEHQGSAKFGTNNDITGANGFASGGSHIVDQDYATAQGKQAKPLNYGEVSISSGGFTAAGDAQTGSFTALAIAFGTSGSTVIVAGGQSCTVKIPALTTGKVYAMQIEIVARWESGTAGGSSNADQAYWSLAGVAFVDSTGSVSLSGFGGLTAPTAHQGLGNTYSVNVSGTTNEQINIIPYTNNASVNARFVAGIRYTSV